MIGHRLTNIVKISTTSYSCALKSIQNSDPILISCLTLKLLNNTFKRTKIRRILSMSILSNC